MRGAAMALVALAACQTPYQRKGFTGGYDDTELAPGRYAIDVQVNSYTSRGTALEYAHRRAGELCPMGYDTIDAAQSQTDLYMRSGNIVTNSPKANVALIIECQRPAAYAPPAAAPARAERADRRVVFGPRPLFCTSATSSADIGACYLTNDECVSFRDSANNNPALGYELGECTERAAAACFNYTTVLTEERKHACAPTISGCDEQLKLFAANPDYTIASTRCGIYRVKPATRE